MSLDNDSPGTHNLVPDHNIARRMYILAIIYCFVLTTVVERMSQQLL
jgi:hypothetical protein